MDRDLQHSTTSSVEMWLPTERAALQFVRSRSKRTLSRAFRNFTLLTSRLALDWPATLDTKHT